MKETNRGKQMKSVWEIKPPESWEKKFGKHPTQKPVALLERILLASTNEGDLVLDPCNGGGTTLVSAFHLRRRAFGCELSLDSIELSLRRICSELAHVSLRLISFDFSLDLFSRSMDRSDRASLDGPGFAFRSGRSSDRFFSAQTGTARTQKMPAHFQLVQQERCFYFIRPHRPPRPLLRPGFVPRRRPPKIPSLRPLLLRRPLHRQNRNRNLSHLTARNYRHFCGFVCVALRLL